jgi:hypothetical protein
MISVLRSLNSRTTTEIRFLKNFPQPSAYAYVLGFTKLVQDRLGSFEKIRVDDTREGPSTITDMENSNIDNAEGVTYSVPTNAKWQVY